MATVTLTALEFTTNLFSPRVLTDGNIAATTTTLDLTNKFGAFISCFIGRISATGLTRPGYIAIRPTLNNAVTTPIGTFDFVSNIYACNATTQNAAHSATQLTVATIGSITYNDICCRSDASAANDTALSRVEFFKLARFSGSVIYPDFDLRVSGNSGDILTTQADVGRIWLPGGEKYSIRPVNYSGQSLCFKVDAQVFASETIT